VRELLRNALDAAAVRRHVVRDQADAGQALRLPPRTAPWSSPRGVHSRAQAVVLALQQEIRDTDQLIVSGLDAPAAQRVMN